MQPLYCLAAVHRPRCLWHPSSCPDRPATGVTVGVRESSHGGLARYCPLLLLARRLRQPRLLARNERPCSGLRHPQLRFLGIHHTDIAVNVRSSCSWAVSHHTADSVRRAANSEMVAFCYLPLSCAPYT